VSPLAWIACFIWIAAAIGVAALRARRGLREGRGARAAARLKSPTPYLFSAYLLIAALVTPISSGETVSPLLGLSLALPLSYALATLSSIGSERPSLAVCAALAMVHGGAALASAAVILALASPAFVPAWLRL
jgi:hypothetical protein